MTTAHDLRLSADPAADEAAAYGAWVDEVMEIVSHLTPPEQALFWLQRMTPQRAFACIENDLDAVLSDYYDRTDLARRFPGSYDYPERNPAPELRGSAAEYVRAKA